MSYTVKQYEELQSDVLPYTTKWGTEINVVSGQCPDCGGELENMKFVLAEYTDCCVIRSVGACFTCKTVVTCPPFKITSKNKYYCFHDNHWEDLVSKTTSGFLKWLKGLLSIRSLI